VLTSRDHPEWPLQRAGHGDIVETAAGELYLVHLASRSPNGEQVSPLGRECSIQKLRCTADGWIRLADGSNLPALELDAPNLSPFAVEPEPEHDDFDEAGLNPVFQWLRTPWPEEFLSLEARPGYLRLQGMESPGSLFRQALVARRHTAFSAVATTCVEFEPDNFQQLAGLIVYYNSAKFHYLYVSTDDRIGRHIGIMSCVANPNLDLEYPLDGQEIGIPEARSVYLRAAVDGLELRFYWSLNGNAWNPVPAVLDAGKLSDEAGKDLHVDFTGTFIGVCCNDLTGMRNHADFDFFSYRTR
jgi:xylan 1,4-beta-xylosidase